MGAAAVRHGGRAGAPPGGLLRRGIACRAPPPGRGAGRAGRAPCPLPFAPRALPCLAGGAAQRRKQAKPFFLRLCVKSGGCDERPRMYFCNIAYL